MKSYRLALGVTLLIATVATLSLGQQACPVAITKITDGYKGSMNKVSFAAAMGMGGTSRGHLGIDYANHSDKDIETVRFGVGYINSMRELSYVQTVTTKEHKVKPGKSYSIIGANGYITGGQKTKLVGWVEKVMFSDGTYWNDNGARSCGNFVVPEQPPSDTPTTRPSASEWPTLPRLAQQTPAAELRVLLRDGGFVTMSSLPQGANISVGATVVATTPAVFILRNGEKHSVTLSKEGYKATAQELTRDMPAIIRLEPAD